MGVLLEKIISVQVLAEAWAWLGKRRGNRGHNDDYWHLLFHKQVLEKQIIDDLVQGTYRFSPCKAVNGVGVWCAQDALVLKALTLVLTQVLTPQLSQHCYHLTGNGGAKGCVRVIEQAVADYKFVCRRDVNSYYATIDHTILMKQLADLIDDNKVLTLIENMLARLDDVAGELLTVDVGITKGNPLSPLLGAVYLTGMDKLLSDYCDAHQLKYHRFMDDWLVLCKTRYQLRDVVRLMNRELENVKMTKHPFKTYIGRIKEEGFDFLGYRIANKATNGLAVAWKTWVNHRAKLKQLYEQNASRECIAGDVKRWVTWVRSGVEIELKKALAGLVDWGETDCLNGEWV